jgi:hypothetical protein
MSEGQDRKAASDGFSESTDQIYQIRIKGHLNSTWSGWLDGLTVIHEGDGTTVLTGPVVDQPALHGLLTRIRDLGLPLLSVQQVDDDQREKGR